MTAFTEISGKTELESSESRAFFGYDDSTLLPDSASVARNILAELMLFRRFSGSESQCAAAFCPKCTAPHLSKIITAIELGLPVRFVLPAFPGKSPNPAKVLGPLPDMAERCALEFLQQLCDRMKRYYSPGAEIVLCADGRVFSDVVGMRDEDVTAYQDELSKMIADLGLTSISTFKLDEFYEGLSFDEMRNQLMNQYGESLDVLRNEVREGGEAHRLYCGITRFMLEDALYPGQTKSRTTLQKESRTLAYGVIQRSKAWGGLVEVIFPQAVRLSIHPQSCGAKKLGIRLIEPDHWLTPWHGVAVDVGGRLMLLKRFQAEQLGGLLIHLNGRPSHYVLPAGSALEMKGAIYGNA